MKSIYVYGASGHGLVVSEIAEACGYKDVIFIDDGQNVYDCFEDIKKNNHIPIVFGIGNNKIRSKLFEKVNKNGFNVITLIDPSAKISPSVNIGKGTIVMPNVVINAQAKIGNGVILNTGSIIEHECIISEFVHISPNASLAGNVKIGAFSQIGIGSCIIQGMNIGSNCLIGAGSVVVNNFYDNIKAYGNPCRKVEEIDE